MPGARCTRGLACKVVRRSAHEHTGSAEAIRHSLRNGFTAYAALSPATNSSCHRHHADCGLAGPVGPTCLHGLGASNGRQDHTVLPYATRLRQEASPGLVPFRRSFGEGGNKRRSSCALLFTHGNTALRTSLPRPTLPRPPPPIPRS